MKHVFLGGAALVMVLMLAAPDVAAQKKPVPKKPSSPRPGTLPPRSTPTIPKSTTPSHPGGAPKTGSATPASPHPGGNRAAAAGSDSNTPRGSGHVPSVPRVGGSGSGHAPVIPRVYYPPSGGGPRIYVGGSSNPGYVNPSVPRIGGTTGAVDDTPITHVAGRDGVVPDDDAPLQSPLGKLDKRQKDGLKKTRDILAKKKLLPNDKGLFLLTPRQQRELIDLLDPNVNPDAGNFSETQRQVLEKILANQPLTPEEMVIGLGAIGQPNVGMTSAAADAIAQGLIDSLAANLPQLPPAAPPLAERIVTLIDQVLQGIIPPPIVVVAADPGGDPGVVDVGPGAAGGSAPPVRAEEGAVRQDRRLLRVKNETGNKLTVYLQYETFTNKGNWVWYPENPGSKQVVIFQLADGAQADMDHDGWPVNARRVRIWGVTADGRKLADYRDRDLWLVEEQGGERVYMARDGETFTFTFGK